MRMRIESIEELVYNTGNAETLRKASSLVRNGRVYLEYEGEQLRVANSKALVVLLDDKVKVVIKE